MIGVLLVGTAYSLVDILFHGVHINNILMLDQVLRLNTKP